MIRKILFSLPVEGEPDIVAEQIGNIRRHCPQAAVCLHVAPQFTGDMAAFVRLEREPGVFVNPNRLEVEPGRGLFHVHVVNFIHAIECCRDIDVIAFAVPDELFVRAGLEAHVETFQAAAQVEMFDPAQDWRVFHRKIERDEQVRAMLTFLGLPTIFGGQAAGQFYETTTFAEMAKVYLRFFLLGPNWFPTEEVLPQSMVLAMLGGDRPMSLPFTLQNDSNQFEITEHLIANIRKDRGYIFAPRRSGALSSPHVNRNDLSSIFAVRSVPRHACALRDHIYSLDAPPGEGLMSAA